MHRKVHFRFHGELNDFLAPELRDLGFEHKAGVTDTIKHVVESIGVPHTEIGAVRVNGEARALSETIREGDLLEVYPLCTPVLLHQPRFVVDGHLGRLAAYLRMLGFDTWYEALANDTELAAIASDEHRLLLTRDAGLLKRRVVEAGYFVRSDKPLDQLREVSMRFALLRDAKPFSRCMACNGELRPIAKDAVAELLPPHTRETKTEFSRCATCGKIYWRGSHYERMLGWITALSAQSE